jgi:hypothetical protein
MALIQIPTTSTLNWSDTTQNARVPRLWMFMSRSSGVMTPCCSRIPTFWKTLLKTETARFSEKLVSYRKTTRRYSPEYHDLVNLKNLTPSPFLLILINKSHPEFVHIFMVYFHANFHIPSHNGSLVVIKRWAKYSFRVVAICCFTVIKEGQIP